MAKGGVITRKDMFSDDALNFGADYANNLNKAVEANNKLIVVAKELSAIVANSGKISNHQQYITQRDAMRIADEKALAALNALQTAERGLTTTREQRNRADATAARNSRTSANNAERERVAELRLQGQRERNIDTFNRQNSAYALLVKRRNEAQAALASLLAAENREPAAIRAASVEFERLDARLRAVDAATRNYTRNIGNYASAFNGLGGTLRSVFAAFGLVGGITLFATIMRDVFSVIKDVDRQIIAVGKTTNITGEALKQFGREVVDLGGKLEGVSIQGLLQASEVAGQLGVRGTGNILKFSTAIEKLKLTSNIISEEQVQNFAKFIEVSSDSFENADRLASVITQLGNNFAATEAEVLANATEIQKGTAVYNSTAQSILGIGAATAALGGEAEASRSAIQSTYAVINNAVANGANLQKVLKLTGLTQKELSDQFNSDAGGVFLKFVGGLNKIKNEGGNLKNVLDDLDLKEKRAFTVVGSLAINYDLLKRAMSSANEEYKANAALNKEVEAASQSISSILGDIKDKWQEYILVTNDANQGTGKITTALRYLRDNLSGIINAVVKYGTVLLTFLAVQKAINLATSIWTALQAASAAAQLRFALATGIGTESVLAEAAAIRAATVAQEEMNVAVAATPWGVILAALAAVAVAYVVFNEKLSEHERLLNSIAESNKYLSNTEANYSTERDKANQQRFRDIEYEMKLRKAQGEDSKKLDDEEIERKKAVLQASIESVVQISINGQKYNKKVIDQSNERLAQLRKERDAPGLAPARYNDLQDEIATEKIRRATLVSAFRKSNELSAEERKRLYKQLAELDKDAVLKEAESKDEESKKARAARLKALKERYNDERTALENEFKLRQFRLQNSIDLNQEIVDAERSNLEERIDANAEANQLLNSKNKEQAEYSLQQLGKYNEETGKLVRELSDKQISELLRSGKTSEKLTAAQKLIYEQYQASLTDAAKKEAFNRQKIIDAEAGRIKKGIDAKVLDEDTRLQESLDAENQLYKLQLDAAKGNQKLLERAQIEHEDRIYEIKKQAHLKSLQLEINDLQNLLDSNDAKDESDRLSSGERKIIANALATAKKNYSDTETGDYIRNTDRKTQAEKKFSETVNELSKELYDSLADLTNALLDRRISAIDNEISKQQDYYDRQIELAGDDQSKKDLLEKEAEKKREKLEDKKRKEQIKAAIFNKVLALGQIGVDLAKTLTAINLAAAALDSITFGVGGAAYRIANIPLAIGTAAAQTATILATPLPKYKDGRKGGKEEFAIVGDGGRSEVIESVSGQTKITPSRSTLVKLLEGDTVHKSVDAFKQSQRARVMQGMATEKHKLETFQAKQFENTFNADTLNQLKSIEKAIKSNRPTVIVQQQKQTDLNHELWKMKQLSRNN